jgi:hypothetical protein
LLLNLAFALRGYLEILWHESAKGLSE